MSPPGDFEARADRLAAEIDERELDGLLVTDLLNVRYLTGFAPTNGLCVASGAERLFFTDFRYMERAGREVHAWELQDAERDLLPAAARRLSGRVGFDDEDLSVRRHRRLVELAPEGVELVPAGGLVEGLRRRKEAAELEAIAEAARLADEVLGWLLEQGLCGRSEREVAIAAEQRMRELGAQGPSFPSIVAAGPNGALPHAEPGEQRIERGRLVVLDMGARLDGYCSDCTRTVAVGESGERGREVYYLVLRAQLAALGEVRAGVGAGALDAVAREAIDAGGHGEEFGHGLGHGVGLDVHEAPRLGPTSDDELLEGDVVTIEPGVYVRGELGVRIEDLVSVTAEGCRNLSSRPKELLIVD